MIRLKATQLKKEIIAEKGQDEFDNLIAKRQLAGADDQPQA